MENVIKKIQRMLVALLILLSGFMTMPHASIAFSPSQTSSRTDFNADGTSDVIFQNNVDGRLLLWPMNNFSHTHKFPKNLAAAWSVAGSGDFNGDDVDDILYTKDTGETAIAEISNYSRSSLAFPGGINPEWSVQGVGDFNGDGTDDILWRRNIDGVTMIWGINSAARTNVIFPGSLASFWKIVGLGDFNNDNTDDILYQNGNDGRLMIWGMQNYSRMATHYPKSLASSWSVAAVGDFNADGTADVLYRKDAGEVAIAEFNNFNRSDIKFPGGIKTIWTVKDVGDFNGDGADDILWRRSSDDMTMIWGLYNSARTHITFSGGIGSQWVAAPDTTWVSELWGPDGKSVTQSDGLQLRPVSVSDGSGGAIYAWEDYRNNDGISDIYTQRVNATGEPLWQLDGVPTITATDILNNTPANQGQLAIVDDGAGGAILTWKDSRILGQGDIFAQRIGPNGEHLWGQDGVPIGTACWGPTIYDCLNQKNNPQIAKDGAGGAIITWYEVRDGFNFSVWAQRVNADGEVLWTEDGVPIAYGDFYADFPKITPDGLGGAYIVWQDNRNGGLYAQRLDGNGVAQWALNGIEVAPSIAQRGLGGHQLLTTESGKIIVTWVDGRSGDGNNSDLYVQKLDRAGQNVWPLSGVPVCTRNMHQYSPVLVTDGANGAFIAWEDQGASAPGSGQQWIFAQRVNADGSMNWAADGLPVYTVHGFEPGLVPDGEGGALIYWGGNRRVDGYYVGPSNYVQHFSGAGQMLLQEGGFEVYHRPNYNYGLTPDGLSDGSGGVVLTWIVDSSPSGGADWDILTQRVIDY